MCSCLKDTSGSGATLDEMGFLGSLFFISTFTPFFFCLLGRFMHQRKSFAMGHGNGFTNGSLGAQFFLSLFLPSSRKGFRLIWAGQLEG